jgi:ankyrin repeat protein
MELIISQYPDLPIASVRPELEQRNVGSVPEDWLHGTPLEMAIIHRHESLTELLLEKGADPNSFSSTVHPSPLCTALDNHWEENGSKKKGTCDGSVRLLIAAGADPNPRRTVQTPLQLAAKRAGYHVVEFLLDNGADANAIGNDDAIVADIKRSWPEWGENNEDDLKEAIL